MIATKTLAAKMNLKDDLRLPVLNHLEIEGWTPAILSSERSFLQNAGVNDQHIVNKLRLKDEWARHALSRTVHLGEVFFKENDLFYLLLSGEPMVRSRPEHNDKRLEIGVISSIPEGLIERLQMFAVGVEHAFEATVDDRKAKNLKFEWQQGQQSINELTRALTENSNAVFAPASLCERDVQIAGTLASRSARHLLLELNQVLFAREQDLAKRWKKKEGLDEAIQTLRSNSLIITEYLVECSRNNTPLARFQDRSRLEEEGFRSLVCPYCGLSLFQEKLSEAYTVTEDGRRMSAKSHWMTIWVTDLLHQLGVPLESILWNITENGEEVDILIDFLGQIWVFELKDKEFGAGDAYPLNYRRGFFKASKAVVITTEKVSPDAKRVFSDLDKAVTSRRRSIEPVYIEGLDRAREVLGRELASASLQYAANLISLIGIRSGLNLSAVLAARFGTVIDSIQEEVDSI